MDTKNCLLIAVTMVLSLVNAVTVITSSGAIEGITADGVNKFTQIPYAKAPINELRFADPQEVEPWNDTLSAHNPLYFVPSCPTTCEGNKCAFIESEDCLFLNVFTPPDAEYMTTDYTVLLWIHGGSFESGSSGGFVYDATNFVDFIGDIIVVSINYRLGILGSLYDNVYDTNIKGNFGFLDQKLAIKWVYDNIEYFGGNKDNIVIFGESAGAQAVGLHLLYNTEYISGGIMQSSPFGFPLRTPETWYNTTERFTDIIGCSEDLDKLSCWRDADLASITSAQTDPLLFDPDELKWAHNLEKWTPTVETQLLAKQPIFEWQTVNNNNNEDDIPPYIIGMNKDEYYFWANDADTYSYNDLVAELDAYFNGDNVITEAVLSYYGITDTSP
eukprot:60517_1